MAGRPPSPPLTALGLAVREHRAPATQDEIAMVLGITQATLARLERGTHQPSYETAKKLAAWLGWTTDQVMEAAKAPAPAES